MQCCCQKASSAVCDCVFGQEEELKALQGSHEKLQQQLEGQVEWWRGQVDELKVQLRGEATRVLDLQKKAYNARMAQEAAAQALLLLLSSLLANSARLAACILQGWQAKSPFCSVQRCKQIVRGKLLHVTVSVLSRVVCVDKDLQSDWLQHEKQGILRILGSFVLLHATSSCELLWQQCCTECL